MGSFSIPLNAEKKGVLFGGLPLQQQNEIKELAKIAPYYVRVVQEQGVMGNKMYMKFVSSVIHGEWVNRNGNDIPATLRVAFQDLPELEKEKPRHHVRVVAWVLNAGLAS